MTISTAAHSLLAAIPAGGVGTSEEPSSDVVDQLKAVLDLYKAAQIEAPNKSGRSNHQMARLLLTC